MRSLALLLLALVSLAAPAGAQEQPGLRYTFQMRNDDGDEEADGTTYVLGDRLRIEFGGDERTGRAPDYLLVTDGGRTVTLVRPSEREYTVMRDGEFERMAGAALRSVDALVRLTPENVRMKGEHRGDGGTILGHPTQRYRLTQRFSLKMRVLGFAEREDHEVVTEYWVSPELALPHDPMIGMLATLETMVAQQDDDFVRRAAVERARLFTGTPLRIVVRSRSWDPEDGSTNGSGRDERRVEITAIERRGVDPAIFVLPEGYTRREGVTSLRL